MLQPDMISIIAWLLKSKNICIIWSNKKLKNKSYINLYLMAEKMFKVCLPSNQQIIQIYQNLTYISLALITINHTIYVCIFKHLNADPIRLQSREQNNSFIHFPIKIKIKYRCIES